MFAGRGFLDSLLDELSASVPSFTACFRRSGKSLSALLLLALVSGYSFIYVGYETGSNFAGDLECGGGGGGVLLGLEKLGSAAGGVGGSRSIKSRRAEAESIDPETAPGWPGSVGGKGYPFERPVTLNKSSFPLSRSGGLGAGGCVWCSFTRVLVLLSYRTLLDEEAGLPSMGSLMLSFRSESGSVVEL